MTEEHEVQQRLTEFVGCETEYWDFWGAIRKRFIQTRFECLAK